MVLAVAAATTIAAAVATSTADVSRHSGKHRCSNQSLRLTYTPSCSTDPFLRFLRPPPPPPRPLHLPRPPLSSLNTHLSHRSPGQSTWVALRALPGPPSQVPQERPWSRRPGGAGTGTCGRGQPAKGGGSGRPPRTGLLGPQTAAEHPAAEHPAAEHTAAEHPAADHTAAEHTAADHTAAEHTAVERSFIVRAFNFLP